MQMSEDEDARYEIRETNRLSPKLFHPRSWPQTSGSNNIQAATVQRLYKHAFRKGKPLLLLQARRVKGLQTTE